MLDPWIIEEIRRREEEQRQQEERRSRLEISIEMPSHSDREAHRYPDRNPLPKQDRGVTIIEFGV